MLQYFVQTATGAFAGLDTAGVDAQFSAMLANPGTMTLYMGIVVVVGFFIVSMGVQKGLERVTKWMMLALIVLMLVLAVNSIFLPGGAEGAKFYLVPDLERIQEVFFIVSMGVQKGLERVTKWMMLALIVLMLVLAVNSIFLPGGAEGAKFYLVPDLERIQEVGVGNVIVGAMNQSFFTLSLGIGAMAIFGSYIGKDHALMGEAVRVCALDTLVALCSGLIIFPACFAYGVDVNSGPPLIFMTLPNVFNHLPLGRLWGSLFFIFMTLIIFPACFAYGVDVNSGPPLIFMTLPNVFNHLPLGRLWGSLFFIFMTFAAPALPTAWMSTPALP